MIRACRILTCDGCGRTTEIEPGESVAQHVLSHETEKKIRGWRVAGVLLDLRRSVPELVDGVTWEDLCPSCVDRRALLVLVGELSAALDEDEDDEPQAQDSIGRRDGTKKKPAAAKAGDKDPDP